MTDNLTSNDLVAIAADIVSSYVGNNVVAMGELPSLINEVHRALVTASTGAVEKPAEPQVPAVAIRKSITPDFLICLEDGKKFKSLKRHLQTRYGLSPEEYRAKWGLPADYPMVAPNYAIARSQLAKSMGLGQQRRKAAAPAKEPSKKGRKPRAA